MAPTKIDAVAGVTAIDLSATLTVNMAVPETPDTLAEILVTPAPTVVANPEAETVATATVEDDQAAVEVALWEDPSL